MKLLRLKLNTAFRSLPAGFELNFEANGNSPYVLAGPNGSGKSNILEALAAIFYHLEASLHENLPDNFNHDEASNPDGFQSERGFPDAFELEYLTRALHTDDLTPGFNINVPALVQIRITKKAKEHFTITQELPNSQYQTRQLSYQEQKKILPDFILGYSSGENEVLSLPFFKMRFIHLDEYLQLLREQVSYPRNPDFGLTYLDEEFSQAILLSNLLMQDEATLAPLRQETGLGTLKRFRIILNNRWKIEPEQADEFALNNPDLIITETDDLEQTTYSIPILHPLESTEEEEGWGEPEKESNNLFLPLIERLTRCATIIYHEPETESLILDYWVNEATHQAFQQNFTDALELFQSLQVLLTLNLCAVSPKLKKDLYNSDSLYVSETIPSPPSDERIMRFKFVEFQKEDISTPVMLRNLSDGEHQLLHSLGLALLYRTKNCLFLLDEPETHFNPEWRARFITILKACQESDNSETQSEFLITTHSPFLISDSKPESVLVFSKDRKGKVQVTNPNYNTFGSSINRITMETFHKRETIGGQAQQALKDFRRRFDEGDNPKNLIQEIEKTIGDSIEKTLLIQTILDNLPPNAPKGRRRIELD